MLRRFGGVARLYGRKTLERFRSSMVTIVGLGGVGSWTAEALARSGVGRFLLIDPDDICVTNTNRQIHALEGAAGLPKAEAMRTRLLAIDPSLIVETRPQFLTASNAALLLDSGAGCVIDAIDRVSHKCAILVRCREINVPAVTIGGAGGRLDPSKIRAGDLGEAWGDDLLRLVRKKLRRDHAFPGGEGSRFGIRCVFSHEPQRYPWADGSVCATPEPGSPLALDCAYGFGTACHITATFGMLAAAEALAILSAPLQPL